MPPNPSIVHLPNGQSLTVRPVFGGFFFKSNELNTHQSAFPAGWTVIIQSEDYADEHDGTQSSVTDQAGGMPQERRHHIHPFKQPTMQNDNLFISSISNPSSNDFKSPTSPTRQIAMMLWATLNWYFHLTEPSLRISNSDSKSTPDAGKPKGQWRINIKREGVFRGRNLIQKLERMGLISTEDSAVGVSAEENTPEGWQRMFTSRRSFWQLSGKLFLFTLSPAKASSFPGSPYGSRPASPVRGEHRNSSPNKRESSELGSQLGSPGLWSSSSTGPFSSGSHLPTYFPPPPLQYTVSAGIRHPIRPKPPRQGETFYSRYIPSVGQYLSFRTASLSPSPVLYNGPAGASLDVHKSPPPAALSSLTSLPAHLSVASISDLVLPVQPRQVEDTTQMSDLQLLHKWMNIPRVSHFWGCDGPQSKQEDFLRNSLNTKHSFPVIGLWDDKPFGFFEVYWVKEDILGKLLGDRTGEFDRGLHVLVGEQEFRGEHRVRCWITALAHWALLQDYRTNAVVLEPRVDNEKFISYLCDSGFLKEGEVTFPHKQSAYVKLRRENFEAPAL